MLHVQLTTVVCLLAALLPGVRADFSRSSDTIRLSNGVEMPTVSAGTWLYNDSVAADAVKNALSVGFTHIDTAYDYLNQRGVSVGLSMSGKQRKDLFITTKVPGCGLQGLFPDDCYGNTLKLIKEDIEMLNYKYPTDYLDLILLHFPPCKAANASDPGSPSKSVCGAKKTGCTDPANCKAIGEQWRAVQKVYEDGLVRAVGVSNYCSACFDCLPSDGVQPMVNQVQLHVGMGSDPQGLISFTEKRGMVVQAWSPLGHGGGGTPEILNGTLTNRIAKTHQKSTAQVALKWIVQHGHAVATKSSNPVHLKQNLDLFSWQMSDREMQALDKADFLKSDTPSFLCDNTPASMEGLLV